MMVFSSPRAQIVASCLVLIALAVAPGTAFGVALFTENFEGVTLGPVVTYDTEVRSREAWSATFPAGWVRDNGAAARSAERSGDRRHGIRRLDGRRQELVGHHLRGSRP